MKYKYLKGSADYFNGHEDAVLAVKSATSGKIHYLSADYAGRDKDIEKAGYGYLIEEYFAREVQPHVPDAWINADKTDDIDKEIGIVGFEIPFNRHFYVYEPPRPLQEIDADLDAVSAEIMQLLGEVHSKWQHITIIKPLKH